jgi:hypothetical protein
MKNLGEFTVKGTKEKGGIIIEIQIGGFTPNEFRQGMFNAITNFTNDFQSGKNIKFLDESKTG